MKAYYQDASATILHGDVRELAPQLGQTWEKQNGTNFAADRFRRVHENACHFYPKGRAWADVYNQTPTTPDATAKQVRRKQRPPHMGSVDAGHYVSEDGGPRLMRSVIYLRNCHGYARHPTQKPEELVRYLVECSCTVGGGILSPFMGSGTDLVVAKLSGRTAVGIDIDEATCESAAKVAVVDAGIRRRGVT